MLFSLQLDNKHFFFSPFFFVQLFLGRCSVLAILYKMGLNIFPLHYYNGTCELSHCDFTITGLWR